VIENYRSRREKKQNSSLSGCHSKHKTENIASLIIVGLMKNHLNFSMSEKKIQLHKKLKARVELLHSPAKKTEH
jgi:hypothetical protein